MKTDFKAILAKFNLSPITMREVNENNYFLSTISGAYLLRELASSSQKEESLLLTYRLAQQNNLISIVSLVLTNEGTVYHQHNHKLYLVSPWIEKSQINWEATFETIAKIHQQTKISSTDENKSVIQARISVKRVKALRIRHFQWIELFERQPYMSPLELQVCTHYREISFAFNQLERLIIALEKMEINSGLCLIHGNLTRKSILGKEFVYIANWENAAYDHPTKDLLNLFKNEAKNYDKELQEWLNHFFHHYLLNNPLTKAELYYIAIALLDIEKYLGIVDKYILTDNFGEGIVRTTMELEKTYYKIIMGLHYVDVLEEYLKSQIQSK